MLKARSAIVALCVLSLIWAYNWIALQEGLRYCDPFDFAALRCVPGALLLFAAMIWMKQPLRPVALPRLFLLGLFQSAGFIGFASWAMVEGAVGKTIVLVYIFPFWTLLIAWPVLGERIRGVQWLALVLAAAGLVFVLEPWNLTGSMMSRVLAVITGICWAISTVIAKQWRSEQSFDLLSVTAWQMLLGGLVLWVLAWLMPSRPIVWNVQFGLALGFALLLGTVAGWLLWLHILKHMSAGIASLCMMIVPALGVLLSRLHYGEQPGTVEIIGMLLIVASLGLLSWLAIRGERRAVSVVGQQ